MLKVIQSIITFFQSRLTYDDRGEVSIEYVLVGGIAAAAIVAGMAVLFPSSSGWFDKLATSVMNKIPG
jgi:Flp pilus assembly pilin Flp